MNWRINLVAVLFAVIFSSCSKNGLDDECVLEKENDPVEITVFYSSLHSNVRKPDFNAKVYLYYNINTTADLNYFTYDGNGVFRNDDVLLTPDDKFLTNNLGQVVFGLEYQDRVFSIMVESAYYPDLRLHSYCFNPNEYDIKWTFIFNK